MNDVIKKLEFNTLDGEPVWSGVIPVGSEKAELHIEAPASGPSDSQTQILAEVVGNYAGHRERIYAGLLALLQSRGLTRENIRPEMICPSIVSISAPRNETKLVLIGELKSQHLREPNPPFQANLTSNKEYRVNLLEAATSEIPGKPPRHAQVAWPPSFELLSGLYRVFLLSGLAVFFAFLLPTLVFSNLNKTFQKVTFALGLILVATGFLSNGICGMLHKKMQGKVGNMITQKESGKLMFTIDIMLPLVLAALILWLAYRLLSGAIPMNL